MSEDYKNYDIVFVPGCFDGFDGTQEELDELVASLKEMVTSGKFLEMSETIDLDDLPVDLPDEAMDFINNYNHENPNTNRKLN